MAAAAIGCSANSYRESADLQVNQILGDREKSTLGYKPQVEVATAAPASTPKRVYEKIPTTPIPPPEPTAAERLRTPTPTGPLGPETWWKDPPPAESDVSQTPPSTSGLARPLYYGPPTPGQEPVSLDLFGCIGYAVGHSRSYRDQMDALYLQALDVTLQRHLFSPIPFATSSLNYAGGQQTSGYKSALTATQAVGVKQQLPYGGQIVAQGLVSFVDALNKNVDGGETAALALSGSLPLLKGAGMINLEPLINSERRVVYQVRAFENFRRQFVVNTASSYFNLLAQQQGVQNRRVSLRNFEALTERARALYDAGRLNFLEVQRSLQSQFSAQTDLLSAEANYQAAVDNFKLIIGMPADQRVEIIPVEMDVKVPHIDQAKALELAYLYRLDLKTAQDLVDDAIRNVDNAKNGLLPDLSLSFASATGNVPGNPAVDLDSRSATYSAGVTLDLPIDPVKERNAYRASLIDLDRVRRNLSGVRDQITADVRDDLRKIPVAEDQLSIQRRGIELARRRLEYSNTLLQQGKISTRDVVEAQTSLLDAQDSFESARSQLQIRILEYLRDTGTLRVDPEAGSLGRAMDRAAEKPKE
jgi:hypothetical protein